MTKLRSKFEIENKAAFVENKLQLQIKSQANTDSATYQSWTILRVHLLQLNADYSGCNGSSG